MTEAQLALFIAMAQAMKQHGDIDKLLGPVMEEAAKAKVQVKPLPPAVMPPVMDKHGD